MKSEKQMSTSILKPKNARYKRLYSSTSNQIERSGILKKSKAHRIRSLSLSSQKDFQEDTVDFEFLGI